MGLSDFEVAAGVISGSVALLADALRNFNDCAALFIAYAVRRVSRDLSFSRFDLKRGDGRTAFELSPTA